MYLVSLKRQSVSLCGQRFDFAQGEAVHTEDSHKYTIESFREMAAAPASVAARGMDRRRAGCSAHWHSAGERSGLVSDASEGRRSRSLRRAVPFQHRRGGVAEEQFLARTGADAHHDHRHIAPAFLQDRVGAAERGEMRVVTVTS